MAPAIEPRALWLADTLRRAGLLVVESAGWQTRGRPRTSPLAGVIVHHTASDSPVSTDLRILTQGHGALPGPISQLFIDRDGVCYVLASGIAHHAGVSAAWGLRSLNGHTIGIECANDGVRETWPAVQVASLTRATAAVLAHLHLGADRVAAHREVCVPAGRKIDPRGRWAHGGSWENMDDFRTDVGPYLWAMRNPVPAPVVPAPTPVAPAGAPEPPARPSGGWPVTLWPHGLPWDGPIVAVAEPSEGGLLMLSATGSVYAFGGAPFVPWDSRPTDFAGRVAQRLDAPTPEEAAAGARYAIIATSGERYAPR